MTNAASPLLDIDSVRRDFPILGPDLVYLDNAATAHKPQRVIDAVSRVFRERNANVHRGVHRLSVLATADFDAARETVRLFLNAPSTGEVIFTKGCTEGINLVATCLGLRPNDVVLLSTMEHHSNIVPWQLAAEQAGAKVIPIPITDSGEIELDAYERLLHDHPVRMVGVVHVSNSLGTVNPVKEMARLAHTSGAQILVDGAQAGPHLAVDVQDLDVDFYTLSCHKIYAPTGVGVLYGKRERLEAMPPYHGGGDMIRTVAFEGSTYADLPAKYEAGTPNVAGVVGLGEAIRFLAGLGESLRGPDAPSDRRANLEAAFAAMAAQEERLLRRATEALSEFTSVRITGTAPRKAAVLAFTMEGVHPHDIGTILDSQGIAIRAGHHCCMPLMRRLGVPATARASFAFYNTEGEVDALTEGLRTVQRMFA
jgi:cysteine desulfurase/selenocysteine lyase